MENTTLPLSSSLTLQSNPHFQHFHMAYIHYRTMNYHIDSIEKTLKTMEKTQDNLKGTMNCLTPPVLHEKGLQNKIRSITNHTQSPSVSFADPISKTIPHYPVQALLLNHYQYHPHKDAMNKNSVKPASTLLSMITYSWPWDKTITMDTEKDTSDTEPIAVPETLEPRPTYPCNLSTLLCKKCNAFHIK